MDAVALLVVIALVSLLITRVATVALTVTGMPRTSARFQARSALSGVGFTTSESESVVRHPVRRRIVMALMLIGNVGLATAVAGLLGSFARADAGESATRLLLTGGLGVVYALSRSSVVDRRLSRVIGRVLARYTDLEVAAVDRLLHFSGSYSVKEVFVEEGSWVAGASLGELRLREEGVVVLGIVRRDGSFLGVPDRRTCPAPGDTLVVYGRDDTVTALAHRRAGAAGTRDHEAAVTRHRADASDERADDEARRDDSAAS